MAQIALIIPLGEMPGGGGLPGYPVDPGYGVRPGGGHPAQPIYPPQGGGGEHPAHPIYPGGRPPIDPGWGIPEGLHPDQGLPVPPEVWPQPPFPPLPPDLESKVVVAVHKPGQPWVIKSYPVAPSQGLPPGQAQPKPAG